MTHPAVALTLFRVIVGIMMHFSCMVHAKAIDWARNQICYVGVWITLHDQGE
jgi:hypothetical protein